jgi:two-component system CheB/CheR fusion protein
MAASRNPPADSPPEANQAREHSEGTEKPFITVGIGASAGGLEAFSQLLQALPPDTGMAFVLIQHLDPKHESMLSEILSRSTRMPVFEAQDEMPVKPNHVHVIPPDKQMTISEGILHLSPRTDGKTMHKVIDEFFLSLAKDQTSQAIGIILSGTATDGVLGLKAIKEEGGITFAQDEKSAKYAGMPLSAIAAGCVDFTLAPAALAKELTRITRHPYLRFLKIAPEEAEVPSDEAGALTRLFTLLRNASGVDFTYYKHTTIKRRLFRRMVLHKFEKLWNYVEYIQEHPEELHTLYEDILINVTGFFRDPEAFDVLKEKVFPKLMKDRNPASPLRIWVPGCATGEEAYSLAMLMQESLGVATAQTTVQIFGTDLSDAAIEAARAGLYSDAAMSGLSADRVRRFFTKTDRGYRIGKSIRDLCVFARQNVVKDPPFSRLDLISCRNLLIYLGAVLQKRVIPIFHYALRPGGFLMLGTSEGVGSSSEFFTVVDKKYKLYSRKPTVTRGTLDFNFTLNDVPPGLVPESGHPLAPEMDRGHPFDVLKEADRLLLTKYVPAGVLVNEEGEILQFRGHTSAYLEPAPGQPNLNVLRMAREGLLLELRSAFQAAKKGKAPVRKGNIRLRVNGSTKMISLEVLPLKSPLPSKERYYLILFREAPPSPIKPARGKAVDTAKASHKQDRQEIAALRQEVASAKEYLQSIVENQEASNEELRSANEEIQSTNEELQSTNEELETAKEELQSANEELTTVNEELQNGNQELDRLNDDLLNLLASVNIAIVMLGLDLRIRRFTPTAEQLLNILPSDQGRRVTEINLGVTVDQLEALVVEVQESLSSKEREVQDRHGHWYSMRIRPYKTTDNKIEGVVIAFVDIDRLRRGDYAQAIAETVREPLLILDGRLRIKLANPAFCRRFGCAPRDVEKKLIYDVGDDLWRDAKLRSLLEEILPQNKHLQDYRVEHQMPGGELQTFLINARQIQIGQEEEKSILLAMTDAPH